MLDAWIERTKWKSGTFHWSDTETHLASLQGLETARSFVKDLPTPRGTLNTQLALPVSEDSQKIVVAMYASQTTWLCGKSWAIFKPFYITGGLRPPDPPE